MSDHASSWARKQDTRTVGRKAVLLTYATYADDKNHAWVSQKTLSVETNQSRRTIIRCVQDLERMGLLARYYRRGADGRRCSNLILLAVDDHEFPDVVVDRNGFPHERVVVSETGEKSADEDMVGYEDDGSPCAKLAPGEAGLSRDTSDTPPCQPRPLQVPKLGTHIIQENTQTITNSCPKPVRHSDDDLFELFWKEYPETANHSKKKARSEWYKIKRSEMEAAYAALPRYAQFLRQRPGLGVTHVWRWLAEKRWASFADDPAAARAEIANRSVTLRPGTPQWEAWREYKIQRGKSVAVMQTIEAGGEVGGKKFDGWTFPSEWPPGHGHDGGQDSDQHQDQEAAE
mgnify:CR=1 FL=1